MADPHPISYQPQFQPPAWKDNVDLMSAAGPNGFNIHFQNLRAELDRLSSIVKQLSDLGNATANALSSKLQPAKWGQISSSGKILSGSGDFTVSLKTSDNKYYYFDIAFDSPFPSMPAIIAAVNWNGDNATGTGGNTTGNAVVLNADQNGCRIYSGLVNGLPSHLGFSFIAYCPAYSHPISYQPQFQPAAWKDNVDLMSAAGPNGFNVQFQNLRAELDRLSSVVKQLSDLGNATANALSSKLQPAKWGQIDAAGQILSGSGDFTVSKVMPGNTYFYYDILFNSPFASMPAVNVTVNWNSDNTTGAGGNTTGNAVVLGANQNRCRIFTGLVNGMPSALSFSFLAYCPVQVGPVA